MATFAVNPVILKTIPIFSAFSDSDLATLIPAVQYRCYQRNSLILRAGEKTNALYVMLAGKAKATIGDGVGREVTVGTIGPSHFFGEFSLIDDQPRSANVQALEPCEVLFIPKSAFMAGLAQNFEAAMLMLRHVIGRMREADRKIASLALVDVKGRLAALLIELAKDVNGEWVVDTGSEELARMVGASREMVSRVVREMIEHGLIRRDKRKIVVLDRASMVDHRTLH